MEEKVALTALLMRMDEVGVSKILREQSLISANNELICGEKSMRAITLICEMLFAANDSNILLNYSQFKLEWINDTPYTDAFVFSKCENNAYNIIPAAILITLFSIDDIDIAFKRNGNYFISTRFIRLIPALIDKFEDIVKCKNPTNKSFNTYLMIDESTGFYKIGKAIEPLFREKTLQSEKPTINLISFTERDIENKLHKKYAAKRLRGEWFNLSEKEVSEIISEFINQN